MIRVGIVGCGGIAQVHAWVLDRLEDCKLTAVCDIIPEKAKAMADKYGVPAERVYTSYEEMLESGSVEAVHICTPHYLHVPMAIEALSRDLTVFMEKPVVIDKAQWEALEQAVHSSKGRAGFCFQNRYNVTTQKLDELVGSGRYGKVLGGKAFVTWRRDVNYYEGSPWKGRWETEGGGSLINQSVHTLDLLLRYLGRPDIVEASMTNHHTADCIEVEDTVEAWLSYDDGKRGCFYATNCYVQDAPILLEVQCEKARLTLTGEHILVQGEDFEVITCEEHKGIGKGYWGGGHLICIGDFYRCLKEEKPFQNDLEGIKDTTLTTLKIYEKGRKAWNR